MVRAGQQALPYRVEHLLRLRMGAGQGDHEIVRRDDHAQLAEGAVTVVTVTRHPELVAVPAKVVGVLRSVLERQGVDVPPGRELHPFARDEPPPAPQSSAQQQFAEGGDGLGRQVQPVEREGGTARHPVPFGVVDAHRREEALVEQFRQAAARDPFHHPGQDEGGRIVVGVPGPLRLGERHAQETLHQVSRFQAPGLVEAVRAVSRRHGQQVVDGEAASLLRDVGRNVVGQHVHHPVVQREQPVGDREPHGDRGERLGQRVEQVRAFGRVRRPPAFGDDVTAVYDHDRVALDGPRFEPVQQRGDRTGRHPRGGRCRPRQQSALRGHPGTVTNPPNPLNRITGAPLIL
ncbi:hypothetical protein GCM10010466_56790 [Planomonospora alba]|uniref:Uncharacterized protein n=1 Tax=Planomonospora alba TaxID=161354 RepID=A0ABP6NUC6_9ACTN